MAGGTVKVVAVQDFDISHSKNILNQETLQNVPDPTTQLSFCRGQCFEVLDKDIKWWLFARCAESQEEGFIPSICVVPIKDSVDNEKLHNLKDGTTLQPSMVNRKLDLAFFPNAPSDSLGVSPRKPCPEEKANILSRFTFWWLNRLIITGFKRSLCDSDLWSLSEKNSSHNIVPRLQHEWHKELKKSERYKRTLLRVEEVTENSHLQEGNVDVTFSRKKCYEPSLTKAMMRVFGPYFLLGSLFKLFHVIVMFVQPYLLSLLIEYTENEDIDTLKGYVYVACMTIVATLQMSVVQHSLHISFTTAMRVNTGVNGMVYTKALCLSNMSRRISTAGEMLNLMAVDGQRVMQLVQSLNQLWSAPLQICIAMYFLYVTMGVSVLAGTGVLVLLIPLNFFITRFVRKLQVKQMKCADERIKSMNEILGAIKVLKLYAWEESFIKKIMNIRSKELRHLARGMLLNAGMSFTFICSPFLVSLATFAVYVLMGNELTAAKAFVAISLFNILRYPLGMLPRIVVNFVQAQVSVHRLEEFLKLDELDHDSVIPSLPYHGSTQVVHIEDGSFSWDKTEGSLVLRNINLSVTSGSLVAVVGQVGCGKSTLLSALLGETERVAGKVHVKGSTAYVPQQAWIQNATLQENVLFGQPRDQDRYRQVISACALDPDINVLLAGDLTEIGEKGINLSGGQKQRVSLARAVYFNADIYLLDDPLSAVDAHVGRHIFDKIIGHEGMLKGKTRILVTHAVQFLPHVDQIIVIQNGEVSEVGSYAELKAFQGSFAEFLETYANENGGPDTEKRKPTKGNAASLNLLKHPAFNRSVSCHFHGNEVHPRSHAPKSRSDVNLTRPVVDKHCPNKDPGRLSPVKKLQKSEYESLASMRSLNSLLSQCEGMEVDYMVEDDSLCVNNESEEDEEMHAGKRAKSVKRQSVASKVSVNSILSLLVDNDNDETGNMTEVVAENCQGDESRHGEIESKTAYDNKHHRTAESPGDNEESKKQRTGRTTSDERSQSGRVKFSVAAAYACALGMFCSLLILLCGIGAESSIIASRIWLAKWSSTNVTSSQQRDLFLGIYGALGLSQGVLFSGMSLVLACSAVKAARNLHSGLLINIMHLPMMFFETTPVGRIVNRFSRDTNAMDDKIPRSLLQFIETFLSLIGTIFVISYSTPLFLTCVLPLGILYVFIQRFFVSTSRQLRRIVSVSRSPVYNHFIESINGTSTIRAYSQQSRFITESYRRVDENQMAHYPGISANRWLALRLEFIGTSVLFFAALFSVISRDSIASGLVGLSVAYALQITGTLNWLVRQSNELETNIVAVERIKEYTEIIREADWIIALHRPPKDWPHQGRVELEHFDLRYRDQLPLVLHDVNCSIGLGEKIGIVGRTGAGKSSLALALFRILERAGGRILIDGVDIATIGLHDLRSRLTIIPQDPVLFSGDLRLNLDPFGNNTDEQLWNVLEVSHLKNFVSSLDKGLLHPIVEGGENLSVGQRQLVCLARALLRQSKILVLDEATAAVDLETDELIQQTIRREFAERTLLIIAHRLNTIMDCDRIMVLQTGSVAEFDTPTRLLANKGLFYGMARDAGLA